ncbi:MAG: SDR family oxidoreductase [Actinomycetota bacterium]|nr:SDR family oxidoreductase [Actinomycetota bacterium]
MDEAKPVAVVTGASRGLGFLLARELGRCGHDLVVCARSAEGLAAARPDLEATGATVDTVVCDVSVAADVARLVDTATARHGRIDVLVNNAGTIQVGPVGAMRAEQFADALGVMLWGVVHPTLAVLPLLRSRGCGRIVNITSIGGKIPAPHLLPYTTAKFAAVGFSEGLRAELAKDGISVTTAVPGLMRTGSPRNALFSGDRTAEHRWFALGDSLPLVSMDAERAARRIVDGALRGRPEIILTPAAKLAVRAHGLAPGLTTRAAALVDRLLPRGEDAPPVPGHTVDPDPPQWFRVLTTLTDRAARRWHQHDDEARQPR